MSRNLLADARQALRDRYGDRLFLTVTEVAEVMRTDPRTIRRGIEAGDIPAVRVSSVVRIPVDRFLIEVLGWQPATAANDEPATGSPLVNVHPLAPARSGDPQHASTATA